MSRKQLIGEIVRDYRHSVRMGMTEHQAQQVLIDMMADYLEAEAERAYSTGEKAGRFGAMSDFDHERLHGTGRKSQLGSQNHI
jgi:hypothetical protein